MIFVFKSEHMSAPGLPANSYRQWHQSKEIMELHALGSSVSGAMRYVGRTDI